MQQFLEVRQARIRAAEDRDILERAVEAAQRLHDGGALVDRRGERAQDRIGAVRARRAEDLLGTTELRDEPVRQREHLRRRAVVLLQPHDEGSRIPAWQLEQVLGPGAGERVDRLVVVAHDTDLVAITEPALEQRLLQQVDVLILVDGERAVLPPERGDRVGIGLEEPDRVLEQILEVGQLLARLTTLVLAVHPQHQLGRDRRRVPVETAQVALGREPEVLRPLDLGREVGGGPEAIGARKRIADLPEQQRLRRQEVADAVGCKMAQLPEGGGVERAGADAAGTERLEAGAQLTGRLVGERHCHQARRRERSRGDLIGESPRDRRRLPRAGPRQNADGAAHRLCCAALLGVQALENVHRGTVARAAADECDVSASCLRGRLRRPCVPARGRSSAAWRPNRRCRPRRRAVRARPARLPASRGRSEHEPRA